LPGDLQRGRDRFEAWRRRRTRGSRIPQALWAIAVHLVSRHGVCRTAVALGLDYYGLKRRADEAADPPRSSAPAFVELPAAALVGKQCRFELDNGAGASLRMHLTGYDVVDVAALACGLWSAE
jgi:hypothetical protein